jgi:hypothetical protein
MKKVLKCGNQCRAKAAQRERLGRKMSLDQTLVKQRQVLTITGNCKVLPLTADSRRYRVATITRRDGEDLRRALRKRSSSNSNAGNE